MFFKNSTLYRLPAALIEAITATTDDGSTALESALAGKALRPIGPNELQSSGFIKIPGSDNYTMEVGNSIAVILAGESKILPTSAVMNEVSKRIASIEAEGRRIRGKERKRIAESVREELATKALTKPWRTAAIIDIKHGFVAVDASSRKTADALISALRGALGSFPAMPLNAEVAPREILTSWVLGEEMPEWLELGEECVLTDPSEGGAVVRCQKQELRCSEIDKHLDAGKVVTKLAVSLDDRVSFVLDESLSLRKIKMLDGALDELYEMDTEGLEGEMMARLTIMGATLAKVFQTLEDAFQLSTVED